MANPFGEGRQPRTRSHSTTLAAVTIAEQPAKGVAHRGEGERHGRRKQKSHIHRIGKTLLVAGISRAGGVERPSVIAGLNFAGDVVGVGVAMVQQQLARAQPARVQIGEHAPRPAVSRGVGLLEGHQHSLYVEPQAGGEKRRQQPPELATLPQNWRERNRSMLQLMRNSREIATAHRRRDWTGQRHLLLVSAGAPPPGCGGFYLGHPGGPGLARPPQPLPLAPATLPADRGLVRSTVCPPAAPRLRQVFSTASARPCWPSG